MRGHRLHSSGGPVSLQHRWVGLSLKARVRLYGAVALMTSFGSWSLSCTNPTGQRIPVETPSSEPPILPDTTEIDSPSLAGTSSSATPAGSSSPAGIATARPSPVSIASSKSPLTAIDPRIADDIARGEPLVVYVVVPLCSRDQIDCGEGRLGAPDDLERNLYWGAIFGARRWFDRPTGKWERVEVTHGPGAFLERVIFRRRIPSTPFVAGRSSSPTTLEQIVVLQAVHGSEIDRAIDHFWAAATTGLQVSFQDGAQQRTVRSHIVGYAGHNRLMDGKTLPAAPLDQSGARPTFVLACNSEPYFGPSLRKAGAPPMVTTRALMAPEGYLIESAAVALASAASPDVMRDAAIATYLKVSPTLKASDAAWIFAHPGTENSR